MSVGHIALGFISRMLGKEVLKVDLIKKNYSMKKNSMVRKESIKEKCKIDRIL